MARRWQIIGITATVALISLLIYSYCNPPEQRQTAEHNDPRLASHARMVQLLDQVKSSHHYERTFHGAYTVESEEAFLESQRLPPQERFIGLVELADRRLWRGDIQKALGHLKKAAALLNSYGDAAPAEMRAGFYAKLGVAYMRLGESQNCVNCNNGQSCLLPISGEGVHTKTEGSRQAIVFLEKALAIDPRDWASRWLLNIAHMTLGTYPDKVPAEYLADPRQFADNGNFPRFKNVAIDLGLNTLSLAGGSIVDDFDGDGDLDVITSSWAEDASLQFFRNDQGKFTLETEHSNLSGILGGLNILQADYDNDGDLDVLVLRGAWLGKKGSIPNSLLQNDGTGRFTDVTFLCGMAEASYPTQAAAWLDYDNDGDLDLYVVNEQSPSQLFENIDGAFFRDIATTAQVTNDRWAKGVAVGDYNNDNYPDIYVSNLAGNNRLYQNQHNGTFRDVAVELQVTAPLDGFPAWFWDFNQDGILDIFAAAYTASMDCVSYEYFNAPAPGPYSRLYLGTASGTFREVSSQSNLTSQLPVMGANFGDLDNDGFPDFYLGTGSPPYESLMPNVMYRNVGGTRFEDITTSGGFGHLQKGHGISFADFDEDGDQDVFAEMGGAYPGDAAVNCVYENPGFGNHWIKIKLVGTQSNRSAIGARIKIDIHDDGTPRSVFRQIGSGGSFGANPLRCEIGLGAATTIDRLTIYWPTSDTVQELLNLDVDQSIVIEEGSQTFTYRPSYSTPPLFTPGT